MQYSIRTIAAFLIAMASLAGTGPAAATTIGNGQDQIWYQDNYILNYLLSACKNYDGTYGGTSRCQYDASVNYVARDYYIQTYRVPTNSSKVHTFWLFIPKNGSSTRYYGWEWVVAYAGSYRWIKYNHSMDYWGNWSNTTKVQDGDAYYRAVSCALQRDILLTGTKMATSIIGILVYSGEPLPTGTVDPIKRIIGLVGGSAAPGFIVSDYTNPTNYCAYNE